MLPRVIKLPFKAVRKLYRTVFGFPFKLIARHRLKNKDFTIICSNCTGGNILHDLGLRFDTPTINMWFEVPDFIKFCKDLRYYLSQEMTEDTAEEERMHYNYPVGNLGTGDKKIKMHMIHYKTFAEAKEKWHERAKRVHWDNLYFIMTDRDGCNDDLAREFDALPYEHKAFITFRDIEGVKSAVKFDETGLVSNDDQPPIVQSYRHVYSPRSALFEWDYVKFLNS